MNGMTAQQRYMLDVFGFLKIEGALSVSELSDAQAAADRYITLAQQAPEVCMSAQFYVHALALACSF